MTIRKFTTWVLSGSDGREHAVTDEQSSCSRRMAAGFVEAVCGHHVITVSLHEPFGPRCPSCIRILNTQPTGSTIQLRKVPPRWRRAQSALRRLLRRPARFSASWATPRTDRPGLDHGSPAEAPTSGGATVHQPTAADGF